MRAVLRHGNEVVSARLAVRDLRILSNLMTTDAHPLTHEEKQARLKELAKLDDREILLCIINALGDESVESDKLRRALFVLEGLDDLL